MNRFAISTILVVLVAPAFAQAPSRTYAQELVDRARARHPEVIILAMHVTPPNSADNVIIASNIGRIGKKADEDDLRVVQQGATNLEVNKKGDHFEVELPLNDLSGDRIGALGVVYGYKAGDDKAALQKKAETLRDELARRISHTGNLIEPYPYDSAVSNHTYAQSIVEKALARHPELLILAIHATPPAGGSNIIVASNIGRIGKKADEDDMRVVQTGKPNLEVNSSGKRFEVEIPLRDASGRSIGALSTVFAYSPGADKVALHKRGEAIRDELSNQIPDNAALFKPE